MLIRVDRNEKLRRVLAYHGAVDVQQRHANMNEFSRALLKKPVVLICTDRASRGMDFDRARVDHVILFDFPKEPSEYVRRVGRTGRAGHPGRATIFVHGRQVPIATSVLSASTNGKKIEPIRSWELEAGRRPVCLSTASRGGSKWQKSLLIIVQYKNYICCIK